MSNNISAGDFNEFKKTREQNQARFMQDYREQYLLLTTDTAFISFKKAFNDSVVQWRTRYEAEHAAFRKAVRQRWGDIDELQGREWTFCDTSRDYLIRTDFSGGRIDVQVVTAAVDTGTRGRNNVAVIIEQLTTGTAGPRLDPGDTSANAPLLRGLVADENGMVVHPGSARAFAQQRAAIAQWKPLQFEKEEYGNYVVTMKITTDHVEKILQHFTPLLLRTAARYGIDSAVVLAIARSGLPLSGLPQPLPVRYRPDGTGILRLSLDPGGIEASAFVHGTVRVPAPERFFNQEQQIELGCAYLYLLDKKFSGITDRRSRLYCSVAAYGAGPEATAEAISGTVELGPAVIAVNKMESADEVYRRLMTTIKNEGARQLLSAVAGSAGR